MRQVSYTRHRPEDAELARSFIFIEAEADDAVRHALLVPRDWDVITRIPIDEDPDAPELGSLVAEDLELGNDGAVFASGWVPHDYAADARAVIERLAARENRSVYRWNDEDDAAGGARAMASDETHLMALRVLPYGQRWALFTAVGPKDRLGAFGGAMQNALLSWRLFPKWVEDPD